MPGQDQVVEQFRQRIAAWLVLRSSVAAVAGWAFAWGTAILAWKTAVGSWEPHLLWGFLGFPVAIALAARYASRRVPNPVTVRAMLDRRSECGGLLMAGAECNVQVWSRTMPAVELPAIRWQARRPLTILVLALGYTLLAGLLPGRAAFENPALDVGRETDRIAEQVRVLKEEKVLDHERAEALAQKLDEVRAQTAGRDPAKTLEALDHLSDVVKQAARQSAEDAAKQAKDLGKVEAGAEAIQNAAPSLEPQKVTALMKELAALAEKAGAENEQVKDAIEGAIAQALKEGKLTKEQLEALAAAAKSGRKSIEKSARKMFESRLIDSKQLQACENGKCDGEGLAKYLKANGGLEQGLKQQAKEQRGKGGVNDDGPGNTPLEFGDRSSEAGAKFKEEALPPSAVRDLKESQSSGVSPAIPKRDPKTGPLQTGVLSGPAAGGGSANSANVLPQHKAAVGRYFDRPMK